jgi:hypothetical protein
MVSVHVLVNVSSISSLESGTPLDRTPAVSFSAPHGTPDTETELDNFLRQIDGLRISNPVFSPGSALASPASSASTSEFSLHSSVFGILVRPARMLTEFGFPLLQARQQEEGHYSTVFGNSDSMSHGFTKVYDGTPGIVGLGHLAEYEKHVKSSPLSTQRPATRVRTEISWLANSFEPHSPFHMWCDEQLVPLLGPLDTIIRKGYADQRQAAANEAAKSLTAAIEEYRDKFCISNVKDLAKLIGTQFSQSSSIVDIIKVVHRCNDLYTVNADRVPEQHQVVDMLLQRLPPYYSSKVQLDLAGLAGDREQRYTFANVGRNLKDMTKAHDSMLFLQLNAGTPVSALDDSVDVPPAQDKQQDNN